MSQLLDLHCHGALGHEFGMDAAGSRAAAAYHRDAGAEVLASLVSAPIPDLVTRIARLVPLVSAGEVRGIHLEGPFLAPDRRGAHDLDALLDPEPGAVSAVIEAGDGAIAQWTFAPERSGSAAFVQTLAHHDILPAIGHTGAPAEVVSHAVQLIVDTCERRALITHLFNGMPPMHHREGGPVAAALAAAGRGDAVVELIADGTHVSAEVVLMVFETVGPEAIALVSDAMSATGLGDGTFALGGAQVKVRDRIARLDCGAGELGTIAGSTSTLAECVRWCIEVAGVDPADARAAATTTPEAVLAEAASR